MPDPTEEAKCSRCWGFACPYAGRGLTRCSSAICDCFIETHPDSPWALHPEAFVVGRVTCAGCGESLDHCTCKDGPDGLVPF